MKFCICFFGVISRSLIYTIDSINKNILDVLTKNNIEYDIYIHNNYVNNMGEIQINNTNYKLLKPYKYIEEEQTLIDKKIQKYIHNVSDQYINSIRQIYSVKCVTELWENDNEYDLYLYLRPDLLYTNELDITLILENINKENVLFTPNWQKWGGLNDRIYFGKKNVMTKIGKRIDLILTILKKEYHSEKFLKMVVDHYNIDTIDIFLKGDRIRCNGSNVEQCRLAARYSALCSTKEELKKRIKLLRKIRGTARWLGRRRKKYIIKMRGKITTIKKLISIIQ